MRAVAFTDLALLTAFNKWLGIGLAIVAAFSASPLGTRMIARSLFWLLTRTGNRIHHTLARILPFLRKSVTVHAGVATAGTSNIRATVLGDAESWVPTETVEAKIEALRQLLSKTRESVRVLDGQLDAATIQIRSEIGATEQRIIEKLADLRTDIARQNHDAAAIDARSLPVIAFGILLSGAPEDLARCVFPVNWLLTIGPTAFSVWMLCSIWASYRRSPSRPQSSARCDDHDSP